MNKDINKEMSSFVKKGYETGDYIKVYNRKNKGLNHFESALFKEMFNRIPKNADILDLGCGAGVPYDKFLVDKGYKVTGIDFCRKHIELAKKFVKRGTFFLEDITKYKFESKFDAIISIYTIFHIPRKNHKALFKKFYTNLRDKGMILITLGVDNQKYLVEDFIGSKMAWSSYDVETYKKMIEDTGFDIIAALELNRRERHLWILASKR